MQPENSPIPPPVNESQPTPTAAQTNPVSVENSGSVVSAPASASPKSSHKVTMILLAVIVLIAGGLGYYLYSNKTADKTNKPAATAVATVSPNSYMAYSNNSFITAVKPTGAQIYKTAFDKDNYLYYESTSPNGSLLFAMHPKATGNDTPDQFVLIDKTGNLRKIAAQPNTAINSATYPDDSRHIIFIDENNVAYVACPASDKYECKIVQLDLASGTEKQIYDTKLIYQGAAPPAYLLGISSDKQSLYLGVSVPSPGTNIVAGSYQIKVSTGELVHTAKISADYASTLSLSPDEKILIYKTGGNKELTALHLVDTQTSKETTINWTNDYISDNSTAFKWSPDSTKAYFQSTGTADATSDHGVIKLAYLDVPTNKIVDLQSTGDSSLNYISKPDWLNSRTLAYERQISTTPNDFTGAQAASYQQDVITKKITKLPTNEKYLSAVIAK